MHFLPPVFFKIDNRSGRLQRSVNDRLAWLLRDFAVFYTVKEGKAGMGNYNHS
jgi:hypothetical protein